MGNFSAAGATQICISITFSQAHFPSPVVTSCIMHSTCTSPQVIYTQRQSNFTIHE